MLVATPSGAISASSRVTSRRPPGVSDGSSDGKCDRTSRVVIAEAAEKEHERPPAAYQLKPTSDAKERERCGDGPREQYLVDRECTALLELDVDVLPCGSVAQAGHCARNADREEK